MKKSELNNDMGFYRFLLNEGKLFLSEKIGDVLTAMQNLSQDMQSMGSREILNICDDIVSKIRKILHGHWEESEVKYLKVMQKIAVALCKSSENGAEEVREIVISCVSELENLIDKIGEPINKIASE